MNFGRGFAPISEKSGIRNCSGRKICSSLTAVRVRYGQAGSRSPQTRRGMGGWRPRLLSGSTPHDPEHANAHRHEIAFHVPVHDRQRRCSLSAFLGRAMRAPINLRSSRFPSRSAPQQARQHPLARPSCVAKAAGRTISAHKIPIAPARAGCYPSHGFVL